MSKKELGQYFTGPLLADLLTSLVDVGEMRNAIDPMVGRGDMLLALTRGGMDESSLCGVDVDMDAYRMAKKSLPMAKLLRADAFGGGVSALYGDQGWDLVITNPPYVRYQSLAWMYGSNPSETIRRNLVRILKTIRATPACIEAAETYPGTADLAVPSWILCAALTRRGGTLAIVLPNSWMTRTYAEPIRTLLEREFSVECIVEDESRNWFTDAQVSTNLMVAIRDPEKAHGSYRRIELDETAATPGSLVGNLCFHGATGMNAFQMIRKSDEDVDLDGIRAVSLPSQSGTTPSRLIRTTERTATMADWGYSVGQGLRTGANMFFYLEKNKTDGMVSNRLWNESGNPPTNPDHLPLTIAVRRQSDLRDSVSIDESRLSHLVLTIPEPLEMPSTRTNEGDDMLHRYVSYVEGHPVVSGAMKGKLIPELSAVRTNGPMSDTPNAPRYWYMLPEMQPRHRPDLIVPRVNTGRVVAWRMPSGRRVLADANFSTLWHDGADETITDCMLALLNSAYFALTMERSCNLLGGGALKCEAATLRDMTIPPPTGDAISVLAPLGQTIRRADRDDINLAVGKADAAIARLIGAEEAPDAWETELNDRIARRQR